MSAASALLALNEDIQRAKSAITAKGGIVRDGDGSSQLAEDIATIGTNEHYAFLHDTTEAYSKTVPSAAMPKATIDMIGGKSVVLNQLVQNGNFESTSGWSAVYGSLSVSDNEGIYTCGSNVGSSARIDQSIPFVNGHKILLVAEIYHTKQTDTFISTGSSSIYAADVVLKRAESFVINDWNKVEGIVTASSTQILRVYFNFSEVYGPADTIKIRNVMAIDLTQMFGSAVANTITTPEQAYALGVPREYVPYNAGEIVHAEVQKVESRDADDAVIGSYQIPSAVRALEGYGQSPIGGNGNYIDFANRKFVAIGHYVDGVWTPLAEPIEIDISDLLTDVPLIDVDGGGTLTFKQQTGGLELPVPNKETYLVEVQ